MGEQFRRTRDEGDPRSVGWTILLNEKDPDRAVLLNAVVPLGKRRGMTGEPLYYHGEKPDEWYDWVSNNYSPLNADRPFYILILGGPDQVPFSFQSFLATNAAVGRLAFDSPDDLRIYVEKILRLEKADVPTVKQEAIFFATNHGQIASGFYDPTYYSHHHLAAPLAKLVQSEYKFAVKTLFAEEATKANLVDTLNKSQPALIFTASHCLGAPDETLKRQMLLNGAIVCQDPPSARDQDWLFGAIDVPQTGSYLEGSFFLQFGSHSYGTLAESHFGHWDARLGRAVNAKQDFVAALPKRLLAHPQGPIGFAGHVDITLLSSFEEIHAPRSAEESWPVRIAPFINAVQNILNVNPFGYAMRHMNMRFNELNQNLLTFVDKVQKRELKMDSSYQQALIDTVLNRDDAQNFMLFGDPGARLRILDEGQAEGIE